MIKSDLSINSNFLISSYIMSKGGQAGTKNGKYFCFGQELKYVLWNLKQIFSKEKRQTWNDTEKTFWLDHFNSMIVISTFLMLLI